MQAIRHQAYKVPLPLPRLFMPGEEDRDPEDPSRHAGGMAARGEDLPYHVEVWSEDRARVEQTLAMTANGSIGYAAYYEATREYPGRYVVLRHKNRVVARWNPPDS